MCTFPAACCQQSVCVCQFVCVMFLLFPQEDQEWMECSPFTHTHVWLTIVVRTLVKIMIPQALTSAHHNRLPKHIYYLYY